MKKIVKWGMLLCVTLAISTMRGDSTEPPETDGRVPFWGTSCGPVWCLPSGQCYQTCCTYVFWTNTGCDIVGVGSNNEL
jgi:hypothetical protein